jgi:hypothetical protein
MIFAAKAMSLAKKGAPRVGYSSKMGLYILSEIPGLSWKTTWAQK